MEICDKLSLADYLWIRKLRNSVTAQMTGNSRHIAVWRQLAFWLYQPSQIEIFLAKSNLQRAGYLVLRQHTAESAYITEVVAPEFQGQGVASAMIDFAKSRYPLLIADIFESNTASIRLHTYNGFHRIGQNGAVVRYVWRS